MITNKRNFFLGIAFFIIPFLGLPLSWKFALIIICALALIFLSIRLELPKDIPGKLLKRVPKKTIVPPPPLPPPAPVKKRIRRKKISRISSQDNQSETENQQT